jgi:DNA-binding LytR/AlgR family response regulator
MIQIAICDDDAAARVHLKEILTPWMELNNLPFLITEFSSGNELCTAYQKTRFDLIFLDIEMPGMTGMETAGVLRRADSHGKIIFLTAYPDYVFQGYEVQAFHYILKPYEPRKLLSVTNRALAELEKEAHDFFPVPNGSGTMRLNLRDILYFYSDKRLITAVQSEKTASDSSDKPTISFYGKLDDLEKELPDYYCRIHQRYLVNLLRVERTEESDLWIENSKLPISRAHKQELLIAFAKSMLREG